MAKSGGVVGRAQSVPTLRPTRPAEVTTFVNISPASIFFWHNLQIMGSTYTLGAPTVIIGGSTCPSLPLRLLRPWSWGPEIEVTPLAQCIVTRVRIHRTGISSKLMLNRVAGSRSWTGRLALRDIRSQTLTALHRPIFTMGTDSCIGQWLDGYAVVGCGLQASLNRAIGVRCIAAQWLAEAIVDLSFLFTCMHYKRILCMPKH